MSTQLKTHLAELHAAPYAVPAISREFILRLIEDAKTAHHLHALINNPHTESFLHDVRLEAAHQRDRFGLAHDRGKSAENWFWLVGYLSGKCLRAVITGDKTKAKHHTISSAAALANWFEAIDRDETGAGLGADADIKPIETARVDGVRCHGDACAAGQKPCPTPRACGVKGGDHADQAVPPGWKLVPVEPTFAMADAGGSVPLGLAVLKPWRNCVPVYAAMLAAAPPPPTGAPL